MIFSQFNRISGYCCYWSSSDKSPGNVSALFLFAEPGFLNGIIVAARRELPARVARWFSALHAAQLAAHVLGAQGGQAHQPCGTVGEFAVAGGALLAVTGVTANRHPKLWVKIAALLLAAILLQQIAGVGTLPIISHHGGLLDRRFVELLEKVIDDALGEFGVVLDDELLPNVCQVPQGEARQIAISGNLQPPANLSQNGKREFLQRSISIDH